MKKKFPHFLIIPIVMTLFFSNFVLANVEWTTLKNIDLQDNPRDIAISKDGSIAFILCEKSIKLFSPSKRKVTDTMPITGSFSQIALSPDGETLLLTDTKNQQISMIQVTPVYDIEIGDSPIIGKKDAQVTVFAFIDYQ